MSKIKQMKILNNKLVQMHNKKITHLVYKEKIDFYRILVKMLINRIIYNKK